MVPDIIPFSIGQYGADYQMFLFGLLSVCFVHMISHRMTVHFWYLPELE